MIRYLLFFGHAGEMLLCIIRSLGKGRGYVGLDYVGLVLFNEPYSLKPLRVSFSGVIEDKPGPGLLYYYRPSTRGACVVLHTSTLLLLLFAVEKGPLAPPHFLEKKV